MSQFGQLPLSYTLAAGADLTSSQYAPATMDSAGDAIGANLTTDFPCGVVQNKPRSAEHATLTVLGFSKARAGAGVTRAQYVAVQSTFFINAVSGGLAIGKAWETVASGGIFVCQLIQQPHTLTTSLY